MATRIMWFRRDLRLADNPALDAAAAGGDVVALFVLDERLLSASRMGAPRLAYLAGALRALDGRLRQVGGRLVVRRGDPRAVVPDVAREAGAAAVHCNADVTPYARARDAAVAAALGDVSLAPSWGTLVHPPEAIRTGSGRPYRVFTPFFRAWQGRERPGLRPAPARLDGPTLESDPLPALRDLSPGAWDGDVDAGEDAALARLERFLEHRVDDYAHGRDRLAAPGTSRLSADLKYGCLSPLRILAPSDPRTAGHAAFERQLAWRDFAAHVMHAWPEVAATEFDAACRSLPWRQEGADLDAWRSGRTGFPVVDAAMRQLLAEGWVHNRARMVAASFLCKDLLVDWRHGEAHFLRHLVDGDVASNNLGWQWAAGTGTDAQPFFRIFNPVSQGTQHDPDGAYVRRYVPELADVPERYVHEPWRMPPEVQAACGVRVGEDYPLPIVDHAQARAEALAWFAAHKG
jgi:deoxyribodipyrimidine photo-lyase